MRICQHVRADTIHRLDRYNLKVVLLRKDNIQPREAISVFFVQNFHKSKSHIFILKLYETKITTQTWKIEILIKSIMKNNTSTWKFLNRTGGSLDDRRLIIAFQDAIPLPSIKNIQGIKKCLSGYFRCLRETFHQSMFVHSQRIYLHREDIDF